MSWAILLVKEGGYACKYVKNKPLLYADCTIDSLLDWIASYRLLANGVLQ